MDSGFFGSKHFLVSAVVAALILGGAASAYYLSEVRDDGARIFADGCDPPTLGGAALEAPEPEVTVENDGRRRIERYTFPADRYQGGALKACIDVGDVVVEPASGSAVEIVFEVASRSAAAVSATEVDAAFASRGADLVVGAWEARRGQSGGVFGEESAGVLLTVRLPETGAYALDVTTDVGDVKVADMLLGEVDVRTEVGDLALREVDLTGNASLRADVGNVLLAARSVQTGRLELVTDVGDTTAELPRRTEVGYDVSASADVGSASIDVGETESSTVEDEGPSERRAARTKGYDGAVTKVVVRAASDVGDASVRSIASA